MLPTVEDTVVGCTSQEETITLPLMKVHPLDIVFQIDSNEPIPELEPWQTDSTGYVLSPWHQQFGNKNACGKRSDKTKALMSKRRKQCRWYNDGVNQVFTIKQPEGFVRGRLPFDRSNFDIRGEKNPRAKKYSITFDDGSVIIICSLRTWCKDNNIVHGTLYHRIQHNNFPYHNIVGVTKL